MSPKRFALAAAFYYSLFTIHCSTAAPIDITLTAPPAPTPTSAFHLGTPTSPTGQTLTVNGSSILLNGQPAIPVMGEFHYSRYPASEWRTELLKMKAGGITVVSTYVFWIHHEEIENHWDWSGNRDLRTFVQTCQDVGLPVIVRMGPWDHGEVRNGGFPEWLLHKNPPIKLRSEDPAFLAQVKDLYTQIATQLKGELWKDGGPVIGVQLDNEFGGQASYLLALKKIAVDSGIDTPLYTRTGWPALRSPMPFGEILPLFGGYAEGFWDKALTPMPGAYWQVFTFARERTDTAVGTDVLGNRAKTDEANTNEYPYLTCELGGGMMTSYHRRIHIDPRDAYALELVKIGSGSNLPGFYMYHGGTNPDPDSPATSPPWLQEFQNATMTNSNDMPVKTYDFQAPLGEFGQIREPYYLLKRTHLFLKDFGEQLAPMTTTFPAERPKNQQDTSTLRYAIRSDGHSGYIFINNYQRGIEMPAKENVQFTLHLADNSTLTVPTTPITIPADSTLVLPFNFRLPSGESIPSTTAEPLCSVTDGADSLTLFTAPAGLPAPAIENPHVLTVDEPKSLRSYRAKLAGKERILYSDDDLTTDGDTVTLSSPSDKFNLLMWPPADITPAGTANLKTQPAKDGPLEGLATTLAVPAPVTATLEKLKDAGPLRTIPIKPRGNAEEPTDADFDNAAVYQIHLPANIDPSRDLLLRLHYTADVARLYLDGKLLTDNFYNGAPFDLSLKRFAPQIYTGKLTLKLLPLQKNAPIYIQKEDQPDFGDKDSLCTVAPPEIIETHTLTFTVK
ncbi:MAG TPA: beta-galactosidase [Phycisphaerae bacterium]|nr:beta-galactosidase [Phycisphaerae bacterium]